MVISVMVMLCAGDTGNWIAIIEHGIRRSELAF